MKKILAKRILICLAFFGVGVWVFNHTPFPAFGLMIMAAYPVSLLLGHSDNKDERKK